MMDGKDHTHSNSPLLSFSVFGEERLLGLVPHAISTVGVARNMNLHAIPLL